MTPAPWGRRGPCAGGDRRHRRCRARRAARRDRAAPGRSTGSAANRPRRRTPGRVRTGRGGSCVMVHRPQYVRRADSVVHAKRHPIVRRRSDDRSRRPRPDRDRRRRTGPSPAPPRRRADPPTPPWPATLPTSTPTLGALKAPDTVIGAHRRSRRGFLDSPSIRRFSVSAPRSIDPLPWARTTSVSMTKVRAVAVPPLTLKSATAQRI